MNQEYINNMQTPVSNSDRWKMEYPQVRRDESMIDCYYGNVHVPDPYRWMENSESDEVKKFVEAQNQLTRNYVETQIRSEIEKALTIAFDYARITTPEKHGDRYFFFKNTGTQDQDVWYVQDSLSSEPRVFLDPNATYQDGLVGVYTSSFSPDGCLVAYGLSYGGSDWLKVHVKNVDTGVDFEEVLEQIKFTRFQWTLDSLGFFYARYPDYNGADGDKGLHRIYYHRVGSPQHEDVIVADFPDNPDWILGGINVTGDGKYLLVFPSIGILGAQGDTMFYYGDLSDGSFSGKDKLNLVPVITKFEAEYHYVANDGPLIYLRTNKAAPNYRIVGIDVTNVDESSWMVLVREESHRVLQFAFAIMKDKVVLGYLEDCRSKLELRNMQDGNTVLRSFDNDIEIGSIWTFSGKRSQDEFFFKLESFLIPGKVYHVDLTTADPKLSVHQEVVAAGVKESNLVVNQVFYFSKDGTKVPMFIMHKKDYAHNINSPTYLYGYGGLNVSMLPWFSAERVVFVSSFDGVYAIPNIRGGGEYGEAWHRGGCLLNKQNSFNDFQCAAEYLIEKKYTVPSKLVINGDSNGGFLVGACINQRPDLFGAAIAGCGPLDMLRYHKLGTMGATASTEFGCSDDGNIDNFNNLFRLSPLHNIKMPEDENTQYPAVFLMTGGNDDTVVPAHSCKHAAEMQFKIGNHTRQTNPILLNVTPGVGHSYGKPTRVLVSEFADIYSFLVQALGFEFKPKQ
ncbi:prolyl endopeptidase isoform X3 [Folsomia candida]|uniref:prolyl endopeptidase isoform X3 n=1 Tax=Folsomia candida TaxID=158441 RepID=UPI001604E53B|nr:prolyl endopeptidase isoform X3 [Folsomia candida]